MMIACVKRHEPNAVRSCSVVSHSLWPSGLYPTRLLCPWGFSGKNEWVAIFLLQGIFSTQRSNLCFLCFLLCWQILYLLSHWWSPHHKPRKYYLNWYSFVFLACVTLCFYYSAKLYLSIHFIKLQNIYERKFFLWQAHLYVSHLILTPIQYETVQYTHFKE